MNPEPAAPAPAYFPGRYEALRARLDTYLNELARHTETRWSGSLKALVLSGGYGRGEGGVQEEPGRPPALYNDLEFYFLHEGRRAPKGLNAWIHQVEREGTEHLGIDVEIKVLPLSALRTAQPSMFYYDLIAAHRTIAGDPRWVKGLPEKLSHSEALPLDEATRLLLNRGSSLYFARHALIFDTPRAHDGYVPRIQGKILLALADAVLVAHGLYHFSCVERNRRLVQIPASDAPVSWEKLQKWHAQGVEFKFHPRPVAQDLPAQKACHEEILDLWREVFLWTEGRRLHRTFPTLSNYASTDVRLAEGSVWKALAQRLRDRLKDGTCLALPFEPGRGVLLRSLALLQQSTVSRTDYARITFLLGLPPEADETAVHDAYRRWWGVYP
jgi:hypothetical protein